MEGCKYWYVVHCGLTIINVDYICGTSLQVPIEVMDTSPSPPPAPPAPPQLPSAPPAAATLAPSMVARSTRSHYNPEENTITNICTSNIIMDLPQVTTRSRTGAIKPQPMPPAAGALPSTSPNPPTVTKIIIKQIPLPAEASSASSTRQPPPLQQMQSTPPPPRLQQMVHAQAPPPLHAKPRGAASAPPPLQIKVVPSSRQADSTPQILMKPGGETAAAAPPSGLTVEMRPLAEVTGTEEAAEEGVGTKRGRLDPCPAVRLAPRPSSLLI